MPDITIYSHQQVLPLAEALVRRLLSCAVKAVPMVLAVATTADSVLSQLEEVEVSFVDDITIADVHLRFMDIPGATDVITFDHGEIHISVETAKRQADEFGNAYERELMLYVIHGLLHLAGHQDANEDDRKRMDAHQQAILSAVW